MRHVCLRFSSNCGDLLQIHTLIKQVQRPWDTTGSNHRSEKMEELVIVHTLQLNHANQCDRETQSNW